MPLGLLSGFLGVGVSGGELLGTLAGAGGGGGGGDGDGGDKKEGKK